jgi:hypothetical protein
VCKRLCLSGTWTVDVPANLLFEFLYLALTDLCEDSRSEYDSTIARRGVQCKCFTCRGGSGQARVWTEWRLSQSCNVGGGDIVSHFDGLCVSQWGRGTVCAG